MSERPYELLFPDKRNSRRTIADAIEVLRDVGGFLHGDWARICIGGLRLPSDEVIGLISVVFDAPLRGRGCAVPLASAIRFQAVPQGSMQPDFFDVDQLDGASVDFDCNVRLSDGSTLQAVEVIPAILSIEPSERDWKIVHQTLSLIEAKHCYRPWPVSGQPVLDCARLQGLTLPQLKQLAWRLAERDPTLKELSQQKIADALRKFGIRIPAQRPKRKPRHSTATI